MTFKIITETTHQTCFRCKQLGIREGNILPGEEHFVVKGERESRACMDCFERLQEEIEQ